MHMAGDALHSALAAIRDEPVEALVAPARVGSVAVAAVAPAPTLGPRTNATSALAPKAAAAPAVAAPPPVAAALAAPSHGSTLHDLLHKGPLSLESALARIGLVAETVAMQRVTVHGALCPWHVRFDSKDATGKPKIAAPDAVIDPVQLAPYRAPELERSDPEASTTPSAEVYALGCMLFEAIAGRTVFVGGPADQAKRHATAAAPPLRMVRRDCELPPALEVEIQRALKKRPGDRHANATAFATAIRAANREDDRATMAININEFAVLKEMMAQAAAAQKNSGPSPALARTGGAAAARNANAPAQAGGPAITELEYKGPRPSATAAAVEPKKSNAALIVALVAIVGLGGGLAYALLSKSEPSVAAPAPPAAALKALEPDVATAVDVPPPDIVIAPEVEVDVPVDIAPEPPEVEVVAPVKPGKGKIKPQDKTKPVEPPKEEKKKDEKKPPNGPAVF